VQSSEGRTGIQYQLYPSELLRISSETTEVNISLQRMVYMVGVLDLGVIWIMVNIIPGL